MLNRTLLLLTGLSLSLSLGLVVDVHSSVSADPVPSQAGIPQAKQRTSIPRQSTQRQSTVRRRIGFRVGGIRPTRPMRTGLSRGALCTSGDTSSEKLIALLPEVNRSQLASTNQIEVESTVAAHPTIFVYIPQTVARSATFSLTNADNIEIYHSTIPLTGDAGVVGISIPEEIPALEVGTNYQWSLSLICNSTSADRDGDPYVDGWVQRIQLDTAQSNELRQLPTGDQPAFYADAGIWQDAVTSLAQLRLANPQDPDLKQDWVDLLTSAQLNAVAQAPLLGIEIGSSESDL